MVFRRSVLLAAVVVASAGWARLGASEVDERVPVPSREEIAKGQQLVKELLGDEYAKSKPASRAALAAKLLKQAAETKDDRIGRYVLLCEARDVAVKAGDPLTAAEAAEGLAAEYRLTAGQARQPLAALAAASMTVDNARAAADVLMAAADAAAAGDDWDVALALLKAAESVARKSRSFPLANLVKARYAQVEKLKTEAAKVKEQIAKLKANPDDPAANLAVGRFLCLAKRDWDAAIPLLAKGASGPLKEAVDKDLKAAQGDEVAQIAAADAWYNLAAGAGADAKPSLQLRAYHWYLLALPKAAGLNKIKAEKRGQELQTVAESGSDKTKVWMLIRKALADQRVKRWPIVGGAFAQKTFEEAPQGGALLIGFRYTTIGNGRYPGVIQPIYLTAAGEVHGKIYGVAEPGAVPQIVKAKPGYAVGAIYVRGGGGFDAFKPIFMRVKNKGLDTEDRYEGPHIGGQGGGEGTVGGDGNFIIGLHGKLSDQGKMEAMSAVSLTTEAAPASDHRGPALQKRPRKSA